MLCRGLDTEQSSPLSGKNAIPLRLERPLPDRRVIRPMEVKDTTTTESVSEDWAKVKLPPRLTGLPMGVWITGNDGYPQDAQVKVSTLRGGRGSWRTAPSIAVRPQPHEIVPGSLPAADLRSTVAGLTSTGT